MKEHPILMSTPMVRAILDGRKTMTRRIVKPQPILMFGIQDDPCAPGMTLWVRETTYLYGRWAKNGLTKTGKQKYKFVWDIKQPAIYAADDKPDVICTKKDQIGYFKRPSIFMPREAARIFLRVTNVKVERLQDITVDDCRLEGCCSSDCLQTGPHSPDCKCDTLFYNVWNDINAKRGYGWQTNPWVWVYEFEKISKDEAYKKEGLKC